MFTKLDSLLDFIESDEYANFSLWKPKYVVYFHDLEIIVAFPENHFNVNLKLHWKDVTAIEMNQISPKWS